MRVISDIKSGKLSADINAIVADVNPITFRSQIYPTGGGTRFVTIPTTVRGMQAHSNVSIRNCSGRRSKYNCQFLQRSTNTNQSRESGNVDKTSAIRCVCRGLVLM